MKDYNNNIYRKVGVGQCAVENTTATRCTWKERLQFLGDHGTQKRTMNTPVEMENHREERGREELEHVERCRWRSSKVDIRALGVMVRVATTDFGKGSESHGQLEAIRTHSTLRHRLRSMREVE